MTPTASTLTTSYQWRRNGTDIVGRHGSTLNLATAGNGDRGDAIRVRVTVNDGSAHAAPGDLGPGHRRQQRARSSAPTSRTAATPSATPPTSMPMRPTPTATR